MGLIEHVHVGESISLQLFETQIHVKYSLSTVKSYLKYTEDKLQYL